MSVDIYSTLTMLQGYKAAKPVPSFLRDNYFPTSQGDFYATEKVTVDFENASKNKLAPAVVKGAVPVQRGTFQTHDYTAPLIAPSMVLTVEQLNQRTFNESIVSGQTPEQREAQYLADDLKTLEDMITRTEEYMAAQTLLNNAYTVKVYLNGYGTNLAQDFSINFYGDGNVSNQAVYTPSVAWDADGHDIISDVKNMCEMLSTEGLAAEDLIMGSSAASAFMNDEKLIKWLDNRRIRIADEVRPELVVPGVSLYGKFDFNGYVLNVYTYSATYTALDGTKTPYFDADKIVVTAKDMGRTAYGAITQYEEGSKEADTYMERRVPHVLINRDQGNRELRLQTRPLVMPKHLNASISADVV